MKLVWRDAQIYFTILTSPTEETVIPERPTVVIEEREDTVEVTVGQYYELRCRARGYPSPVVTWSRLDNIPLPQGVSVVIPKPQDNIIEPMIVSV